MRAWKRSRSASVARCAARLFTIALTLVAAGGAARAFPPDALGQKNEQPLTILDGAARHRCPTRGAICFVSAGSSTVMLPSDALTSMAAPELPSMPRFQRVSGKTLAEQYADDVRGWSLELTSTLRHPAWTGNALFLLYDGDTPGVFASGEMTALYQAPIRAGRTLSARLNLTVEDGFRAGHRYHLRVVQLIKGKEVLLAEGNLALR